MVSLKKPGAQDLHTGCRDAVPGTDVNFPAPHFVCSVHTSPCDSNVSLRVAGSLRHLPKSHVVHCVSVLLSPTWLVQVPGGHFVWRLHTAFSFSSLSLRGAGSFCHLPLLHSVHCVFVLLSPTLLVQ